MRRLCLAVGAAVILLGAPLASIAAESGDQYRAAAAAAYKKGDLPEMLRQLKLGVEANNIFSIMLLADEYFDGDGKLVAVDQKAAARLYEKAAGLGDIEGTLAIADAYYNGEGVEIDEARAIRYLLRVRETSDRARAFLDETHKIETQREGCQMKAAQAKGYAPGQTQDDFWASVGSSLSNGRTYVKMTGGGGGDMLTIVGPRGGGRAATSMESYYRSARAEATGFASVVNKPLVGPDGSGVMLKEYAGKRVASEDAQADAWEIWAKCTH